MKRIEPTRPAHGFDRAEFEHRAERARSAMMAADLDALVVTTPQNVRYFTGFETQFWESPTRPWYLVVPVDRDPIAVIPEIGGPGMSGCGISDVRTWPAPWPEDDGISLLAATLDEVGRAHRRIGWEFGRESWVRAPMADVEAARSKSRGLEFVDGTGVIWSLRMRKSEAEIDRIRWVCDVASRAFEVLPSRLAMGDTVREAGRKMAIALLEQGADNVPFLACTSGPGGYNQIIVGPGDAPLAGGDVLFIDTGATYDGYFCDFDRNFAFGTLDDTARRVHEAVWEATEAGIDAVRAGATTTDLWRAMARRLEAAGSTGLNVGRMGHGLGMALTEPPSNRPGDDTVLEAGMVVTIEPGMAFGGGRMIVHEENVVVRDGGCELLTRRASREMPVVGG